MAIKHVCVVLPYREWTDTSWAGRPLPLTSLSDDVGALNRSLSLPTP
jgi:hypothetical protein